MTKKRRRDIVRVSGGIISPGCCNTRGASAVFTTPTINGYKRYRFLFTGPRTGRSGAADNRGVMIRMLGGPGDPATRLEKTGSASPAANPYLYMASQILSGLDGVNRKLEPGPSADTP